MNETAQVLLLAACLLIVIAIIFSWRVVRATPEELREDEVRKAQQKLTAQADLMKKSGWTIDAREYNKARFVRPGNGGIDIAWVYIMKDLSLKRFETTEKENADVIETKIN